MTEHPLELRRVENILQVEGTQTHFAPRRRSVKKEKDRGGRLAGSETQKMDQ